LTPPPPVLVRHLTTAFGERRGGPGYREGPSVGCGFHGRGGPRLEADDMATLDTLAIARALTDAGADPKLADAITAAVREAATT